MEIRLDDAISHLLHAQDLLSQRIMRAAPRNDEEREDLEHLVKLRDGIDAALDRITELRVPCITGELEQASGKLDDLTTQLDHMETQMNGLKKAIGISAQIVDVAVQIASHAMGL